MAVVELKELSKRFNGLEVVSRVSLIIQSGEFLALLGPSGCGKTTTLQMIAGFVEPSAGDIIVGEKPITRMPPHKRNIGVVFQSYALFPHLSVFENVAFGLQMRGVKANKLAARVEHALDLVRLGGLQERLPRQLSGGQQQRVALARALVIEPSVLLLDEPLSNLDANLREQMRFEIREIQKRIRITTLFVTHDQAEAMAAADRLALMDKGRLRQIGTVEEIYDRPADAFVANFIGQANVLQGKAVFVEGGRAQIDVPAVGRISARSDAGLRGGEPAVLIVRPESIQISASEPAGTQSVPAVIRRVTFLGGQVSVGLQMGDRSISALIPRPERLPAEGDRVFVSWVDRGASILPNV